MNDALAEIRLSDILHAARSRNASDIHLTPGSAPVIRVNGALMPLAGSPIAPSETAALVTSLFDDRARERLDDKGDSTIAWRNERAVRIHALRAAGSVSLSFRLLQRELPSIASLNLPRAIESIARNDRGLVIFAGPTGSGKSTSLAAVVRTINMTAARRIVTIEDPIEYEHRNERSVIVQREVGRDVPSFSDAIVGALRADPDVILLGEMREPAAMRAAITAAETGHLVLTTLHTGDAVQTVDRIVDAFAGSEQAEVRTQLANVLSAVVCQRLVPSAQGGGRRVVAEVLLATDAVRSIIRDGRTHQLRNVMQISRAIGMQTMEHHLDELLAQGAIPPDAREYAVIS